MYKFVERFRLHVTSLVMLRLGPILALVKPKAWAKVPLPCVRLKDIVKLLSFDKVTLLMMVSKNILNVGNEGWISDNNAVINVYIVYDPARKNIRVESIRKVCSFKL